MFLNKRGGNIKGLEEAVLVAKEGPKNMFQPSQARVVIHVFWNVTVISSHERDFLISSILNQMKTGTIWGSNMNQRRLKLRNGPLNCP
jgi:hypothetical protein